MDALPSVADAAAVSARHISLRLIAALVSAVMVALLFPPFPCGFLVWVALVPLLSALWSIQGPRAARHGFLLGGLAGVVSWWIQLRWVAVVSPVGQAVLASYLGLYWGVFGAYASRWGNPWRVGNDGATAPLRVMLATGIRHAAVWAGLELLRGWLFTGFGWNALGVAFHESRLLAQSADLLGVAGLSILPVFVQSVWLQAARRASCARSTAVVGSRVPGVAFLVAVAAVVAAVAYGGWRITNEARRETQRLKALLVQINIPQEAARQLWSAEEIHLAYEEETLRALDALKKDPHSWPDWVMWPESALTGRILRATDGTWGAWRENDETIERVRAAGSFQLIYGVNELEAEASADGMLTVSEPGRAWNSLAVMPPEGGLQTYRKHHLVIFGETIPFVDSIPWLKRIYEHQAGVAYGGSFTPGVSFEPLAIATASGAPLGAIPTVCFEDTVPRLVRQFVRRHPQVMINVTNDGWFKESAAAAQHFANARFRAIELRRPMLRCANNGVSAAVDATGSTAHPDTGAPQVIVDAAGSHFTRGALLAELDIPLDPSTTLYARIGDWGLAILSLVALLWRRRSEETLGIGD
jgi:apolipoprotein N-acyltransferase